MPYIAAHQRRGEVARVLRFARRVTLVTRPLHALAISDKLVVVSMAPDPEPLNAIGDVVTERSIVATDPHGPQRPNALEM